MSSTQQRIDTTAPTEGGALTSNLAPQLTPPPAQFNFAQHLLDANAARAEKVAYIDDVGGPDATASLAGASVASPPPFGARAAARRTCPPADARQQRLARRLPRGIVCRRRARGRKHVADRRRIRLHARAQSRASGLRLRRRCCRPPIGDGPQRARARADGGFPRGAHARHGRFRTAARSSRAASSPAVTGADEPAFWLYSSGSTGRPKGTVHTHANLYWTAELYGKAVLGLTERDRLLLGVEAVLRLRPRQRADLPALRRRFCGAHGRASHAGRDFQAFGARSGRRSSLARPQATPRCSRRPRCRCASRWRSVSALRQARRCRGISASASPGQFGCYIIDGIGSTEMLHIFISNRPATFATVPPASRSPATKPSFVTITVGWSPTANEVGDLYIQGPSAALMYLGGPLEIA